MIFDQEYKSYPLQEVKAIDEGYGVVEGLGNTSFFIDRYGDIVTEYIGVEDLVKEGFVADSHGLDDGSGEMGNYSYKGSKGVVDEARIVPDGLFVKWSFDPSPSTQEIRQKVAFRIDKGKSVYMSIGYRPAEQPVYVDARDFERVLPKYIPADKLDQILQQAKGFSRLRLLKAAVNEISLALRPVNTGSVVTSFKSESNNAMKIDFTKDSFKAEFLGKEVEDRIALGAIGTLCCMLQDTLYSIFIPYWDETPESEDEQAETMDAIGAIAEFAALASAIVQKMQEIEVENGNAGDGSAGMTEAEIQGMKALRLLGIMEYKAAWTAKYIDNLPDSSFAYIETGGKKDADGKTEPRSLRHFPYKDANGNPDAAHVRNALARIPQSKVSAAAKKSALSKIRAAAKDLKIGTEGKSLFAAFDEFKVGAKFSGKTTEQMNAVKDKVQGIVDHGQNIIQTITEMMQPELDPKVTEEQSKALDDAELDLIAQEYALEELY